MSAMVRIFSYFHGKNYLTLPLHDHENGVFYFISRDRK